MGHVNREDEEISFRLRRDGDGSAGPQLVSRDFSEEKEREREEREERRPSLMIFLVPLSETPPFIKSDRSAGQCGN